MVKSEEYDVVPEVTTKAKAKTFSKVCGDCQASFTGFAARQYCDACSTPEKKRARDASRKVADRIEAKIEKQAIRIPSEAEWFESQRSLLTEATRDQMQSRQDYIHSLWDSMELHRTVKELWLTEYTGVTCGDEELVELIVADIKEHGTIHSGFMTDPELASYQGRFTGHSFAPNRYWQQPMLLARLEAESPATKVLVRYGFNTALHDDRVYHFLVTKACWTHEQALELLKLYEDTNGEIRAL